MKRLALICLFATLALAGSAVAAAPPDGTLTVKNGIGRIVINGKGAIIGHFDSGFVQIRDPDPNDGTGPIVNGADTTRFINEKTTRYSGTDVRFRMIGGTFSITIVATNIDLSVVGKGNVWIVGRGTSDDGSYSANGGAAQEIPFPFPDFFSLVPRGPAAQPGG
ncbi:MAG: hypothetical protein ACYDA3_01120 [Gaiellaceae bacterium]